MKYLSSRPFSVPVAHSSMTEGEWASIWAPKCKLCGRVMDKLDLPVCTLCWVHHPEQRNEPTND